MKKAGIYQNRATFRRHYLKEWLAERHMTAPDLVKALNEPDNETYIDKAQVYRWLKGQLPQRRMQLRIAAALALTDTETGDPIPELLSRHPAEDWIARKLQGKSPEDIERVKQAIELILPDRTGTDG